MEIEASAGVTEEGGKLKRERKVTIKLTWGEPSPPQNPPWGSITVKLRSDEGETAPGWVTLLRGDSETGPFAEVDSDWGSDVTFDGLEPGKWYLVETRGMYHCQLRWGPPVKMIERGKLTQNCLSFQHFGIKGEVRFQLPNGQAGTGDPNQVQIMLLQGEQPQGGFSVSGPDQGGQYWYFSMFPPLAGTYTVRGTYQGQVQEGPVTVPNDCANVVVDVPGITVIEAKGGAHAQVQGPTLTFTVQMPQPPGGGGGGGTPPGGGGGGGTPPPGGGGGGTPPPPPGQP